MLRFKGYKISLYLKCFFLFFCILSNNPSDAKYIHPMNIKIMKHYLNGPWPYELKWPHVPRILALHALQLYKAGKSIVIDSDNHIEYKDHHIVNSLHIQADKLMKLYPSQLNYENKYLIIYCA